MARLKTIFYPLFEYRLSVFMWLCLFLTPSCRHPFSNLIRILAYLDSIKIIEDFIIYKAEKEGRKLPSLKNKVRFPENI